jgi:hypothetical protein
MLGCAVFSIALSGPTLQADDDDRRVPQSVTVAFGGGLNTAQPGNRLNHHILPKIITVRTRPARGTRPAVPGVVNFVVGGFHQIYVYNPGVTLREIQEFAAPLPPPPANFFINYRQDALLYEGINPANLDPSGGLIPGANPGGPDVSPLLAAGLNRVEQVGFTQPGLYLVICNVTPHFKDGMIAWVRVVANNDWDDDDRDDDDDDDDEHRGHRD